MSGTVPTYDLYGESRDPPNHFKVHCETIASRSSSYHWEIGLHRHVHFRQFLYIRHGSGDAMLEGATIPLTPPCVVFVPPGPIHGFRFSRDIDGLVITVMSEQARTALPPAMPEESAWIMPLHLAQGDEAYIAETFRRIAEEYDAARPDGMAVLDAYLTTLSLLLRRHGASAAPAAAMDGAQRHVAQLMELIGRHFRQKLTAGDYARRLGMSATHLNRIVRRITGMTTHDLIIGRSIEEAKRTLALTGANIQHISDSLGFSDAAYFSRCFRQRTGLAPRDYRRNARLDPQGSE